MLMKYVLGIRVCEIICLNKQDISFAINSWISAKKYGKMFNNEITRVRWWNTYNNIKIIILWKFLNE